MLQVSCRAYSETLWILYSVRVEPRPSERDRGQLPSGFTHCVNKTQWHSSVYTATILRDRQLSDRGLVHSWNKRLFSSPKCSDWLRSPPNGYRSKAAEV